MALPPTLNLYISMFMELSNHQLQEATAVRALGALAQEHRLAAYRLLVQAGPEGLGAGLIAEAVGLPPSSMSFHLAQLSNAGLVTQRRRSRSIIYAADYAAMNGLMDYLTENCCGGSECAPSAACQAPVPNAKDVA